MGNRVEKISCMGTTSDREAHRDTVYLNQSCYLCATSSADISEKQKRPLCITQSSHRLTGHQETEEALSISNRNIPESKIM